MNETIYFVYLDDAGNSGLEVGAFNNREKALEVYNQRVDEFQKDWNQCEHERTTVDEHDYKETHWNQPGFGQTWHFKRASINEVINFW